MIPEPDSGAGSAEPAPAALPQGDMSPRQGGLKFSGQRGSPVYLTLEDSRLAPDWAGKCYLALDFETTGLDALYDRVVEVGAIRFRLRRAAAPSRAPLQLLLFDDEPGPDSAGGDAAGGTAGLECDVEAALSCLVKPGIKVPPIITKLNGICDADLATAVSFGEIAPLLLALTDGAVIIAHNAPFDLSFLYAELQRLRSAPCDFAPSSGSGEKKLAGLGIGAVLDTRLLAKAAYPKLESYRLVDLAGFLGLDRGKSHRAFDDAHTCMELFLASAGTVSAKKESRAR